VNILGRAKKAVTYTESQTTTWLAWLAFEMRKHDQTVFLIENLQPSWFRTDKQRSKYIFFSELIPILAITLLVGWALLKLFHTYSGINIYATSAALCFTPLVSPFLWAFWRAFNRQKKGEEYIKPVEMIKFSWPQVIVSALTVTLTISFLLTLLVAILSDSSSPNTSSSWLSLTIIFFAMVITFLPVGILLGLSWGIKPGNIEMKIKPNQGILNSVKIALVIVAITILLYLLLSLIDDKIKIISAATELTPFIGLIAFFRLGGLAFMRHYLLRLMLSRQGCMALKCARFLDYAAKDLNFLQKVGGGYIFVHRYLLEHFATMEEAKPVSIS